jgi:hypothetical protein
MSVETFAFPHLENVVRDQRTIALTFAATSFPLSPEETWASQVCGRLQIQLTHIHPSLARHPCIPTPFQ